MDVSSPWGTPLTTTVQAPNLVADFVPTSGSAQLPATVSFTATGTTDGGPITAWEWNFGDGESGVGRVVSHTYTSIGDYTVTLTVTDTCGYTGVKQIPGTVNIYNRVFLPIVLRG